MSRTHELEVVSNYSEQHYDETAVLSSGIESALDGYAKDGKMWEHAKEVFNGWIEEGYRADDALNLALEAAQDGAETTSQEAAKRFWSVLPTDTAIENALDGYANDKGIWTLGRWTFEDMVEQGEPVHKALDAALAATGQDPESTPARASLRFWDTIQPSYVKKWMELPMNQMGDGIIVGPRIHTPKNKAEGAGTYIGDQEGQAVIVKHGDGEVLKLEHDILASVDHRGIPHVTSYTEDAEALDGLTRLAMEQLPGRSLDKIINITPDWKSRPLPQNEAINIGIGLVADFQALSDGGYLYRDLHPGHVIVDEKNGQLSVGLVDVESAVAKDENGVAVTPLMRGTWETMSPEEFYQGSIMTEASNVYSIGCLMLQLVTGESPFTSPQGADEEEIERMLASVRTLHEQLPDIRVPGKLGEVITKALDPDSARRYQSLEEFSSALRSAL
jgi:serine/threonine protein kinase